MEFEDRTAIVTGSGRGVGREIALALGDQGVDVAVVDVDQESAADVVSELRERGVEGAAIKADVTDYEATQKMAEEAIDKLGPIDILVNNAGVWTVGPFSRSSPDDWDTDIGVCLEGTLNCTRAVIGHMIEQEYGRILNVVSEAGRIGEPYLAVYSGAKAGVIGFAKALSKEVASRNITVNNVALGITDTEGASDFIEQAGREDLVEEYPMGRIGQTDDVVPAALFFLQDDTEFVTGQTLSVSGGYTTV